MVVGNQLYAGEVAMQSILSMVSWVLFFFISNTKKREEILYDILAQVGAFLHNRVGSSRCIFALHSRISAEAEDNAAASAYMCDEFASIQRNRRRNRYADPDFF